MEYKSDYDDELLKSFTIFDLTDIQWRYYMDKIHKDIILSAGRRSRKTLIGKRKGLLNALKNPNYNIIFGSPTFTQSKRIFWNDFIKTVDVLGISSYNSRSELVIELNSGSLIQVVGLDRAFRIEGVATNEIYVTEAPNVKFEYWDENIFPMLIDTAGILTRDGTPDFRNPDFSNSARYNCGGVIPEPLPNIGAFAENPNDTDCCFYTWLSSDVIDNKILNRFRQRMDKLTFEQEFCGAYVESKGRAFYAFNKDNLIHKDFDVRRTCQSWDVNYSDAPMATILIQEFKPSEIWGANIPEYVDSNKTVFVAVKEFINKNTNTVEQCKSIQDYFDKKEFRIQNELIEYGDRVGHDRRVGAPLSHYQITRQYFGNYRNYSLNTRTTLSVIDRIASANGLLCNAAGQRRLFINHYVDDGFAVGCPELVADLERCILAGNGVELDKRDRNRTHAVDALTYWTYYEHEVNFDKIFNEVI